MRILIVGAGIAGLATYLALSRRGFRPRLVERNAMAGAGGAALFLPGNGVRALGELGLRDALMNISVPIACQRFFDEEGRLLSEIDADRFWRDVAPCRSMTARPSGGYSSRAWMTAPFSTGTSTTSGATGIAVA